MISTSIPNNITSQAIKDMFKTDSFTKQSTPSRKPQTAAIISYKYHIKQKVLLTLICMSLGVVFSIDLGENNWQSGINGGLLGLSVGFFILFAEFTLQKYPYALLVHTTQSLGLGMLIALMTSCLTYFILPSSSLLASAISLGCALTFPYLSYTLRREVGNHVETTNTSSGLSQISQSPKILDTSSIIDGRIFDLCHTGFFEGPLLIPRFVLGELQFIADSPQSWRRTRGKRGLEILNSLQNIPDVQIQIIEEEFSDIPEVDHKLIKLAKKQGAKLVTNDWNLAKVASLQEVQTLNVNQLAHQLKPPVLPGEVIRVFINKEGDLAGQGVAHLDDGTMIVVDQAREYIKETVDVVITKFMQTQSGRILFGSRV